jgi:hypothetical protein
MSQLVASLAAVLRAVFPALALALTAGAGGTCSPIPIAPPEEGAVVEVCDGRDDDGDGRVDDTPARPAADVPLWLYRERPAYPLSGWMNDLAEVELACEDAPLAGRFALRLRGGPHAWAGVWMQASDRPSRHGTDWSGASALCYSVRLPAGQRAEVIWINGPNGSPCGRRTLTGSGEWRSFCEPVDHCPGLDRVHDLFGYTSWNPGVTVDFDEVALLFPRPAERPRCVRAAGAGPFSADGAPLRLAGIGFNAHDPALVASDLARIRAQGFDAVRTWGETDLSFAFLDAAAAAGLSVVAGVWLPVGNEWAAATVPDYRDDGLCAALESLAVETVTTYGRHPAVAAWLVGNEVLAGLGAPAGGTVEDNRAAFVACLDRIAGAVKAAHRDQPVGTAGVCAHPLPALAAGAPRLDFYGANAYGCADTLAADVAAAGWDRPLVLSELGPDGWWEKDGWCDGGYPDAARGADLARRWCALAGEPATAGAFAFAFLDVQGGAQPCPGFGLFAADRTPRASVAAVRAALEGSACRP